ncbi:carbon starvation protein A [Thermodesulfobacteriota bacterium]
MPSIAGVPPTGVWTVILLVYAYAASTLPVTTLLQPRDFINAWQLFIAMGLLVLGIFVARPAMVSPAFNPSPPEAPPLVPFLFITIACGAISGFHALVAGGTSSKQLLSESDARLVGYGSMLTESFLAVLVIIACGAGLGIAYAGKGGEVLSGFAAWNEHYATWSAAKGLGSKVAAFVVGSANMIAAVGIPKEIGIVIMGVFVASFAGTTLDTATRIQRYVITELAADFKIRPLAGKYVATFIAVATAAALAFFNGASGNGALTLWPLFGTINQLLAGMSLIIISFYLKSKGKNFLITLVPACAVLLFTSWALVQNLIAFHGAGNRTCLLIGVLSLALEVWMVVEGVAMIVRQGRTAETAI